MVNAVMLNVYIFSDFCVMLCNFTDLSEPKVDLLSLVDIELLGGWVQEAL